MWETRPIGFPWRQFIETVPTIPSSVNLSGQTAIVTGSSVGLGFDCARQLLELNISHLILAVRSQTKGDEAAKLLQKQFRSAKIEVFVADMASYKSVLAFSQRCASLERLDIAILNAGLTRPGFERADETKHEMTFQVNYLSTALLTILLLPILKAKRGKSPARLSVVGSDMVYWARWENAQDKAAFEVTDDPSKFTMAESYQNSKLLLLRFLNKLSQHVPVDDVIVNVANPGMCKGTMIANNNRSKLSRILDCAVRVLLSRHISVGARQFVDATTFQGKESHGGFVRDGKVKPFPVMMYENGGWVLQEMLWQETMQEFAFANPTEMVSELNE